MSCPSKCTSAPEESTWARVCLVGLWSEEHSKEMWSDLGPRSSPKRSGRTLIRGEPREVWLGPWSEENQGGCGRILVRGESKGYGPYACVQHAYVRPEDDIHQTNGPDYVKFPETVSTRIGLGIAGISHSSLKLRNLLYFEYFV